MHVPTQCAALCPRALIREGRIPVPSRPSRDSNALALLGLVAVLVILAISGFAMYVTYQHPALAQPLSVAAGVATVLLAAVALAFARR
ncbi:hypothetical protein [Streptomyces ortus]|uniref:Uncharacterized protein n=1 Tax=Streptomyces ortus TaxID=2867268 RepID=A0ABT3UVW6_9ACTN|nr:hypothetical protein [Streptomyces ortus]MCX4231710.1 hypothetical protein [Streptomyces ortus]